MRLLPFLFGLLIFGKSSILYWKATFFHSFFTYNFCFYIRYGQKKHINKYLIIKYVYNYG